MRRSEVGEVSKRVEVGEGPPLERCIEAEIVGFILFPGPLRGIQKDLGLTYRLGCTREGRRRLTVESQRVKEDGRGAREIVDGGAGLKSRREASSGRGGKTTFTNDVISSTRVQLGLHHGGASMPKFVPSFEIKKISSKARLLKRGVPVNKRLQVMIGLLQAVENRIYHNEQAACRAKNLMNAVGILLQELPALMDSVDKEHDGYNYVLFDYGKQAGGSCARLKPGNLNRKGTRLILERENSRGNYSKQRPARWGWPGDIEKIPGGAPNTRTLGSTDGWFYLSSERRSIHDTIFRSGPRSGRGDCTEARRGYRGPVERREIGGGTARRMKLLDYNYLHYVLIYTIYIAVLHIIFTVRI